MNKKETLTTWEAACIITGYGLGAGVLSMPYLAARNGILVSIFILILSLAASYILHLMIADLAIKCGEDGQIISCLSRFLFRGRFKNVITGAFFVLMAGVLCFNLATYISGAAEVIVSLIPMSMLAAKIVFYFVAALVVLFGLKAVGISETITVMSIFILVGILAVASLFHVHQGLSVTMENGKTALAYFGMAMFAMSAFFSVPQAVDGLQGDKKKIRKAVFMGLFNNFLLILIITVCSLLASTEVTQVTMIGWSMGIGKWAHVLGGIFTILAMLTTYWSLSLALGDIVREMIRLDYRICWGFATLPSLIFTVIKSTEFLELMRTTGGLIAILIAFMVVPAYQNARKEVEGSILSKCGGKVTSVGIIVAYLLMAIGSVVSV